MIREHHSRAAPLSADAPNRHQVGQTRQVKPEGTGRLQVGGNKMIRQVPPNMIERNFPRNCNDHIHGDCS